ncbi:albumin-2 [Medicago truncatula]|uniref:albumin-2 n=1 Tax=Medicago truncatula TaxID=3880 RepID=UPI000D2F358B|nr:albumin-2 [Medicago truncatula]
MPNYIIGPPLRSFPLNESYMFMKKKYVVLNYAPGEEKKDITNGPNRIIDGFPMLDNTIFENGIDCALDIKHNKAFIFSGNQCAKIKYAPNSTDSRLLSGPIPIAAMFP